MQNELCKCFVQENIKEFVFKSFQQAKIEELLVSLCDGRPCIMRNQCQLIRSIDLEKMMDSFSFIFFFSWRKLKFRDFFS